VSGVWSNILTAAHRRQLTLLGILDLSAAFDCVDQDILLQQLQIGLGMSDVLLWWIRVFLAINDHNITGGGGRGCHVCVRTDRFITERPLDRRQSASLRRQSVMESSRMVVSQRCFTAVRRYLVYYGVCFISG